MAATPVYGVVPDVIKHGVRITDRLRVDNGIDVRSKAIVNVLDPTLPQHAATKAYVDAAVASFQVSGYLPLTGGTLSGGLTITTGGLAIAAGGLNVAAGGLVIGGGADLGSSGARVNKGWFTSIDVSNTITGSVTGSAGSLSATLGVGTGGTGLTSIGDGQVIIGSGGAFVKRTVAGTTNRVTVTDNGTSLVFSTPQDLHTAANITLGGATVNGAVGITGDLTVHTSTLKVDSTNSRVGIGTASPASPMVLDVAGRQQIVSGIPTHGSEISTGTSGLRVSIGTYAASSENRKVDGTDRWLMSGIVGLVNLDSSATAVDELIHAAAISGLVRGGGARNVVGGYFQAQATANNNPTGQLWAVNTVIEDQGYTINGGAGAPGMYGVEADFNIDGHGSVPWGYDAIGGGDWPNVWTGTPHNAATFDQTSSRAKAESLAGAVSGSIASPVNWSGVMIPGSRAFSVRALRNYGTDDNSPDSDNNTSLSVKWQYGLYLSAGSCQTGIYLGHSTRNPTDGGAYDFGAAMGSMPIIFAANDGSGERESIIFMDSSGNLLIRPGVGRNVRMQTYDANLRGGGTTVTETGASGFVPGADQAYNLGDASTLGGQNRRWANVCATGVLTSSRRAEKCELVRVDPAQALRVVQDLPIYSYQYNDVEAEHGFVGFMVEDADPLILHDHQHVNPNTTASVALAAIQALSREVAELRAMVRGQGE